MKKLSLLFFIACFLSLGLSKCKRDWIFEPVLQLPPETQTGANTFGCLVDGEIWLPKISFPTSALSISYQFEQLIIGANKGNAEGVDITITNLNDIGIYSFVDNKNDSIRVRLSYFKDKQQHEFTSGHVHIKRLDRFDRIVSGTFEFVGENAGKKYVISSGRFDLRYN